MPLNVSIRLGADTFDAAGDVTIDAAFLDLFRAWVSAVLPDGGVSPAQTIRDSTAKIKASTETLTDLTAHINDTAKET